MQLKQHQSLEETLGKIKTADTTFDIDSAMPVNEDEALQLKIYALIMDKIMAENTWENDEFIEKIQQLTVEEMKAFLGTPPSI